MPKKGYVEIDIEVCKGCNLCVIHCPTECLALNKSDTNSYSLHYAYLAEEDKCIACMNCSVICPDGAITVYREVKQPAKEEAAGGDEERGAEGVVAEAGATEGGKVG